MSDEDLRIVKHTDPTKNNLRTALKRAGLSLDPDDWRDSQGFGRAVMEAAGMRPADGGETPRESQE